jgi:UDP-glucuronate decarboxylase
VAGGAGFIGHHLVHFLLRQGADVTVLDNLTTARPESRDLLVSASDRVTFLEHDIVQPVGLDADILCNLACPASPVQYQGDPLRTWKTSVLGTMHLAEMAQARGMTFVQASTSEVYGDPLEHPQSETYWGNVSTIGVRACYDEGKRAAETYLTDLARMTPFDLRIARIFNTYGPGMAFGDGRAVSNFVEQALRGQSLTLFGDGLQTRSLCYVDDLVKGLVALATVPAACGEVVNLGNPAECTIRSLAELVQALTGSTMPFEHCAQPQHDPQRRCPDISKAGKLLGWAPRTTLEAGLSSVIDDFSTRLKAAGELATV